MGVCSSCGSKTAVSLVTAVTPTLTAKLVLEDGRLQEFNRPVKVSEILQQLQPIPTASGSRRSHHAYFVCDADGMGMEGVLSALEADEELKAGQFYFLLPLSMMRRRLGPQEMAELAVKASSALINSPSGIAPLVFPAVGIESSSRQTTELARKVTSGGRRVKRGTSRPYFNVYLGVIPEYVEGEVDEVREEEEVEEERKLID